MPPALPKIYLARHGETPWTITGQHTGKTDLPLTERGERDARCLGERLKELTFAAVYTSPRQRARKTCELAGFGPVARIDEDLAEWDYGAYEGRTSAEIHHERPGWSVFGDGFPAGETLAQVGTRAERVVALIRATGGDVLLFSHGHLLRILTASWLGVPLADARLCAQAEDHGTRPEHQKGRDAHDRSPEACLFLESGRQLRCESLYRR